MSALSWFGDRLNPILVKEVRQALRGRYFRVTYALTLLAATGAGVIALLSVGDGARVGQAYFMGIYLCLAASLLGLVPFQAFVVGGNRTELLQLTALRPLQIVGGRLMSSLVQGGLILVALCPFLALSFLLPGVDLMTMLFVVIYTVIFSACTSSVTIAASFLTDNRMVRVLLMVGLGGVQFGMVGSAMGGAAELLDHSESLLELDSQLAALAFASFGIGVALFSLVGAALRISHAEENRSTALRVLVLGFALVGLALTYIISWNMTRPEPELALVAYMGLGAMLMLPAGIFSGEAERLGRRVQVTTPKRSLAALLATPLMPGGGNGALFNTMMVLSFGGILAIFPPLQPDPNDAYESLFLFCALWALSAFNLPTALMQRWSHRRLLRVASAFAPGFFFFFTALAPALIGVFSGNHNWMELEHPLCFPWAFERLTRSSSAYHEVIWAVALVLAGLTVVVNLPRVFRGVRGVQRASAERRAAQVPSD